MLLPLALAFLCPTAVLAGYAQTPLAGAVPAPAAAGARPHPARRDGLPTRPGGGVRGAGRRARRRGCPRRRHAARRRAPGPAAGAYRLLGGGCGASPASSPSANCWRGACVASRARAGARPMKRHLAPPRGRHVRPAHPRRRHHRRRRGPRRRPARPPRRPDRPGRFRLRHQQRLVEAGPRRPALPGARRLPPGLRGAARAPPAAAQCAAPRPAAALRPALLRGARGCRRGSGAGLLLYDLLAGRDNLRRSHALPPDPPAARVPRPAPRRAARRGRLLRRPDGRRPPVRRGAEDRRRRPAPASPITSRRRGFETASGRIAGVRARDHCRRRASSPSAPASC